jgi:hypothetical protein
MKRLTEIKKGSRVKVIKKKNVFASSYSELGTEGVIESIDIYGHITVKFDGLRCTQGCERGDNELGLIDDEITFESGDVLLISDGDLGIVIGKTIHYTSGQDSTYHFERPNMQSNSGRRVVKIGRLTSNSVLFSKALKENITWTWEETKTCKCCGQEVAQ